jgi:hypothetical protein
MTDGHDRLDEALRLLHQDARASDSSLDEIRARVLAATATSPEKSVAVIDITRSRTRRFLPFAAAAAAALVVGAVAVQNVGGSPEPSAVAATPSTVTAPDVSLLSAREVLTTAADAITATDVPLRPGQYRLISTHGKFSRGSSIALPAGSPADARPQSWTYLQETQHDLWIPADENDEWLDRRRTIGEPQWLGGTVTEAEAEKLAAALPSGTVDTDNGERTGKCGDFFPDARPKKVCGDPTDMASSAFYAALPRDADGLYDFIVRSTAQRGSTPSGMFHYGVVVLSAGLMPADLRAEWYRAMARIEGVEIVESATTLDGRTGVALGHTSDRERRDLIIDPSNGDFIGERTAAGESADSGIAPGTVLSYTSVTTSVVDGIGES